MAAGKPPRPPPPGVERSFPTSSPTRVPGEDLTKVRTPGADYYHHCKCRSLLCLVKNAGKGGSTGPFWTPGPPAQVRLGDPSTPWLCLCCCRTQAWALELSSLMPFPVQGSRPGSHCLTRVLGLPPTAALEERAPALVPGSPHPACFCVPTPPPTPAAPPPSCRGRLSVSTLVK